MSITTMTWNEFQTDMDDFAQLADRLGDDWHIFTKNDGGGNRFLIYKQKVPSPKALTATSGCDWLQIEYHIVYSVSYQVPMMFFQVHKCDGTRLTLEEVWHFFCCITDDFHPRADMLNILTQMEHPVLFAPFLAFHPCRTGEILAQTPGSHNRIITFISLIGPFIGLQLMNSYGIKEQNKKRVE